MENLVVAWIPYCLNICAYLFKSWNAIAKVILSLQIPPQVFNYTIKASTSRFHKTQDVYKKENS
jgi:hypothetical protein